MKEPQWWSHRTLWLATVSALARAPGFLIPLIIAALFGAGADTDAYFIAYSAAVLVGGTLGQAIEVAIVPHVAREATRSGGAVISFLSRIVARCTSVAGVVWLLTVPLLVIAAPKVVEASTLFYAAILTPLVVAWVGAAVYSGTMVSQWRIGTSTGSMLIRGTGALGGFLLAPAGAGLWAVAAGLGAGEIGRLAFLRSRAKGLFPATPSLESKGTPLTNFQRSAGAQVLVGVAGGIAPVVERIFATALGIGAVSHLEYAARLLIVPTLLFDGAMAPLLLARWTHHIAIDGRVPDRREVLRVMVKGVLLAAGCAMLLAVLAPVFVHALLGHGRFGLQDEVVVSRLMRWLSVGFVATMGALLVERAYLAATRNRPLLLLAVMRAALRVGVVAVFLSTNGLMAFAIGYAVADWSYLLGLVLFLRTDSERPSEALQAPEPKRP